MRETELAWAAGVFEATGTATVSRGQPMLNIKQRLVDGAPSTMLQRFYGIVGAGHIGGPYRDNPATHPGRRPYAMWYATGHDASRTIGLLWPWLGAEKRAQWDALADR